MGERVTFGGTLDRRAAAGKARAADSVHTAGVLRLLSGGLGYALPVRIERDEVGGHP